MRGIYPLIALALVFAGFGLVASAATPGPETYEHTFFMAGLTAGGINATSTNDTTATFLASDLRNASRLEFTPNVTGITATLPATSTLSDFVPRAGMSRELMLCNGTTTAAASFTLAFGTGMDANLATSTLAIESGDCASLKFSRSPNSDIDVFYDLGY